MNHVNRTSGFPRQRGVALFVALIMLLLMSLIGITAMQVTVLQERMAGNFKVRHDGFEAGETLLGKGRETVRAAPSTYGVNCYTAGNCVSVITDPNTGLPNQAPWVPWLTSEPTLPISSLKALRYCPSCSAAALPPSGAALRYYSVAAIDGDPSGDAKTALQGIYIF
ncbi:pilus assembly PilX family protein [Dokdonella soli]|uniref:Type 4 fimbrial biogenesis protein PilX N-terminal domain-containing protein n=1 Tax=Dokdonella soli TaxID=529810 RepID=A0ABN1IBU2_9GAMM